MHSCTLAEEFDTFPHKVETSKLKSDELIQTFVATQKLQDYYFVNSEIQHYSSRLRGIRGGIYKATRISSSGQIQLRKYNFQQEPRNFCFQQNIWDLRILTSTNTRDVCPSVWGFISHLISKFVFSKKSWISSRKKLVSQKSFGFDSNKIKKRSYFGSQHTLALPTPPREKQALPKPACRNWQNIWGTAGQSWL